MIDRTFIADWQHVAIPLALTMTVIAGALLIALF
jgi:hypothetical protein